MIVPYDSIYDMNSTPPFKINTEILSKIKDISHELGVLSGAKLTPVPIKLRRNNKIKTIQASLGIEGNTLSIEQVTALLSGARVIAPKKDILEVNNAIKVYDDLKSWNPISINALKRAHRILMRDLIPDNGKFRTSNVGIYKGRDVIHVAPPAKNVDLLMHQLFAFIKNNQKLPWIIKSCVFHYELEFIHPFRDGNGRIGRLWQQLLLMKEDPVFEFISLESLIKLHQKKYYEVLELCDAAGESTLFIEFSLGIILMALQSYNNTALVQVNDIMSRFEYVHGIINSRSFSRKDYVNLLKSISTSTASRDLLHGVQKGILIKEGNANQTRYKFNLEK